MDVLDAQRTLFEIKEQHINSLKDYHNALAELEGLLGNKIETIIKESKK